MSKKFFNITALALLAMTLGACNNTNPSNTNGPSTPDSDIISSVMSKAASSSFATQGALKYWSLVKSEEDAQPTESTNSLVTAVLTSDYFYVGKASPYDPGTISGTRYDKNASGYTVSYQLDPLTNDVAELSVVDRASGQPIPFDSAFANPFNANIAPYCFEVENSKLKLTDEVAVNFAYLFNTVYGGKSMSNSLVLTAFEIGFDEDYDPTTLYIEFTSDNDYVTTKDIYDGAFVDPTSIAVDPIPEPRAIQDGQDRLGAMFNSLQEMNYTADVTYTTAQGELHIVTYVTPTAYYIDTNGDANRKTRGAFETDKGLLEFQKDGDDLKATAYPKQIRTVEQLFKNYWTYSPQSFDVDPTDGSFTLADLPGFTNPLFQCLTTESMIYAPISPANIRLTVDTANGTLSYTYSSGTTSISGTVKNIGTTSVPVSLSDVADYVAPTNWDEWLALQPTRSATQMATFLDVLTDNHRDVVPFIYTPYDYHRSVTSQGPITINMTTFQFTEEVKEVKNFTTAYQLDTCEEAVAAYNELTEKVKNDGYFTYDFAKNIYTYQSGDVNLTMEIYIVNDYLGAIADEVYNFALMVDVQNPDYVEKEYEPIFI